MMLSKKRNIVSLCAVRAARQAAITARHAAQRIPEVNAERRVATPEGESARLLWVTQGEADFLSHMYEFGPEAAARRLMELAGKPWPRVPAKPRKVDAS
jgi:hypothetical protein